MAKNPDAAEETEPGTSRRTFMQATGTATAAAAIGAGAGGATAQQSVDVDGLVSELSLRQKVGQMTKMAVGSSYDPSAPAPDAAPGVDTVGEYFSELELGAILTGGAVGPSTDPAELAEGIAALQEYNVENSTHGIPFLWGVDAVHGNDLVAGGTILPQRINMGATRDLETIETAEEHTAESVAGVGWHWNYAPTTDLQRDPRWGRFFEGVSESPKLLGDVSKARIRGFQSQDRFCSCLKHFGAYSIPDNGNDRAAANTSLRDLRQSLLPPYRMALEEDPKTVMLNSGSVNGVPAHVSDWLVGRVLRGEYGFDGVVTTDYDDFYRVISRNGWAPDTEAGLRKAIKFGIDAGIDMYMIGNTSTDAPGPAAFIEHLVSLVEDGEVPTARIDESVRRILELKAELGLFEDPTVEADTDAVGGGQQASADLARESMVLLKNDDGTLPLSGEEDVLLTGPGTNGDIDTRFLMQHGGWTLGWQGIQEGYPTADGPRPRQTTLLEGLEGAVASVTHVPTTFEANPYGGDTSDANGNFDFTDQQESDVRAAAPDADAVVVVLGEGPHNEGFGDRDRLELDPAQRAVVDAAVEEAPDTPVVGVVLAGSPRGNAATFDELDAVVFAGQPGSDGGTAVAEVLTGAYNPSGRLAFQWPESVGKVPNHHNHLPPLDDQEPLYPISHGLSYTDFAYANVSVSPESVDDPAGTGTVTLGVDVTNAGDTAGDHVVDVFNTEAFGSVIHPERRLLGYSRVEDLAPGETRRVDVELDLEALEVVPGDMLGVQPKAVEATDYELTVGRDGPTTTLTVESAASLVSDRPVPGRYDLNNDGEADMEDVTTLMQAVRGTGAACGNGNRGGNGNGGQ